MLERKRWDHDTDGWIYVPTTWTLYIYIHIRAKRVQRPQPGKRRHTNSVFQTTSLFF